MNFGSGMKNIFYNMLYMYNIVLIYYPYTGNISSSTFIYHYFYGIGNFSYPFWIFFLEDTIRCSGSVVTAWMGFRNFPISGRIFDQSPTNYTNYTNYINSTYNIL